MTFPKINEFLHLIELDEQILIALNSWNGVENVEFI